MIKENQVALGFKSKANKPFLLGKEAPANQSSDTPQPLAGAGDSASSKNYWRANVLPSLFSAEGPICSALSLIHKARIFAKTSPHESPVGPIDINNLAANSTGSGNTSGAINITASNGITNAVQGGIACGTVTSTMSDLDLDVLMMQDTLVLVSYQLNEMTRTLSWGMTGDRYYDSVVLGHSLRAWNLDDAS